MTSRPRPASRRNPLAVIEPSGNATSAATFNRSGTSDGYWFLSLIISPRSVDVAYTVAHGPERRLVEAAIYGDAAARMPNRGSGLGERQHRSRCSSRRLVPRCCLPIPGLVNEQHRPHQGSHPRPRVNVGTLGTLGIVPINQGGKTPL